MFSKQICVTLILFVLLNIRTHPILTLLLDADFDDCTKEPCLDSILGGLVMGADYVYFVEPVEAIVVYKIPQHLYVNVDSLFTSLYSFVYFILGCIVSLLYIYLLYICSIRH